MGVLGGMKLYLPAGRVLVKDLVPKGMGLRASLLRGIDDLANRARFTEDIIADVFLFFSTRN